MEVTMTSFLFFTAVFLFSTVQGISTPWRPVIPAHTSTSIVHQEAAILGSAPTQSLYDIEGPSILLQHQPQDSCSLYKISMSQQLYFEYVHYKIDLPDMKEFTLCMWTKFHNHTNDHPLFSYAVGDQPRGILAWVANTARSSYYMMNIDGHNLYRLNYPLRLNKWYHSCQSWNGRTGEWQIWVNDERVGRGFNNRLVGHVIKGGGIPITGQEQRQLGGGFLEGEGAPQGSGGLLGEVTMVQLYNVALSAGKAHKDHKHHHAHHYEHDTSNNAPRSTTRAPITGPPLAPNPFLTGGQINTQVKINPGAPLQVVTNGITMRHPSFIARDPVPQPFPPANPVPIPTSFPIQSTQFFGNLGQIPSASGFSSSTLSLADGPYHNLFKREKSSEVSEAQKNLNKRELTDESVADPKVTFGAKLSAQEDKKIEKRESEKKKRGLVHLGDGLIVDDAYTIPQGLDNDYFNGLASFGLQLPKYENKDDEREPAEAEVKMVMDICDGCAEEPFEKALIMGWRSVPKKLYSGALYMPATQTCKAF